MTKGMAVRQPRALGFWMCLALVVGNMIGSGVFMLPASLAPFGWNAIFGWLITIGGGLCLAFVFARLAGAVPQAGGPYAYTRAAFGPLIGFVVAWSYWITLWVGNAAIAVAAISYLSVFMPAIRAVPGLPALLACACIWTLTAVNCRGVAAAGRLQVVTTVLKLLPLLAVLVLAAVMIGQGRTPAPFRVADIHPAAITATATLTLWALLGLESATIPADKVEGAGNTIARATLWGMAITGVIYLLVCSAVTLLMPATDAARSSAPIADFIALHWGEDAGMLVALFAAISAFGALNGWILLQGEMPWAMARDGVFPRWLGVSSRRGTPVRAHIVSSILVTAVMLTNYSRSMADLFTFIALLATSTSLVAYLGCSLAAFRLLRRDRIVLVVASATALYSIWTLYGAGPEATGWGLVLLAAGAPVYWLVRRSGTAQQTADQ
ncbi:APC family permease [Sphingomonas sp. KC8]|uniref:APC family permease n=1 Tax=Sphingomonas sp. KC8 TaxID=1030157 RepID=UPI0002488E6E|nr:amino acid permease [Sphingomonas sp. KC8]ARS26261.1 amino acid permease [Sphingomonas sp. KC8]